MSYDEIATKIDAVTQSIDKRINNLRAHITSITDNIKSRDREDTLKYQYELERDHYKILKYNNEIVRSEMFKKRCRYYKDYLYYVTQKDLLNIKRNEYNFIKILQDETIFYFDSKENELKQRAILEKIAGKEITSYEMIKDLEKDRDKKFSIFLNREFHLDSRKIYSLEYLNYNISQVTDSIYMPKDKKKAA